MAQAYANANAVESQRREDHFHVLILIHSGRLAMYYY